MVYHLCCEGLNWIISSKLGDIVRDLNPGMGQYAKVSFLKSVQYLYTKALQYVTYSMPKEI